MAELLGLERGAGGSDSYVVRFWDYSVPEAGNWGQQTASSKVQSNVACDNYFVGSPGISITGRISTAPTLAPGIRAAMLIASSISFASIRK